MSLLKRCLMGIGGIAVDVLDFAGDKADCVRAIVGRRPGAAGRRERVSRRSRRAVPADVNADERRRHVGHVRAIDDHVASAQGRDVDG